jgi:hypothetical protein
LKDQIIYKAVSLIERANYLIWNLILTIAIIVSIIYFTESPVIILIVLLFLFIAVLLSSYSLIIIYPEKVEIISRGLFRFNSSKNLFQIDQIARIETNLKYGRTSYILGQILFWFMPAVASTMWNDFTFICKDGTMESFSTKINQTELIKAFHIIRDQSKNQIELKPKKGF